MPDTEAYWPNNAPCRERSSAARLQINEAREPADTTPGKDIVSLKDPLIQYNIGLVHIVIIVAIVLQYHDNASNKQPFCVAQIHEILCGRKTGLDV